MLLNGAVLVTIRCQVPCAAGYEGLGVVVICESVTDVSGNWSIRSGGCSLISNYCDSYVMPTGYVLNGTCSRSIGSVCESRCDVGYEGAYMSNAVCLAGPVWKPATGCHLIDEYCSSNWNGMPGYSPAACSRTYLDSNCTIPCAGGYENTTVATVIECLAVTNTSGEWSVPDFCTVLADFCPTEIPVSLRYNSSICENTTVGAECNVTCATNYHGDPTPAICLSSGVWGGNSGCIPDGCEEYTPLAGYVLVGECLIADIGDSCAVRCATGYGGDVVPPICLNNHTWSEANGCKLDYYAATDDDGIGANTATIVGASAAASALIGAVVVCLVISKKSKSRPKGPIEVQLCSNGVCNVDANASKLGSARGSAVVDLSNVERRGSVSDEVGIPTLDTTSLLSGKTSSRPASASGHSHSRPATGHKTPSRPESGNKPEQILVAPSSRRSSMDDTVVIKGAGSRRGSLSADNNKTPRSSSPISSGRRNSLDNGQGEVADGVPIVQRRRRSIVAESSYARPGANLEILAESKEETK